MKLSVRAIFEVVHRVEEYILSVSMLALAGLTILNVFTRTTFNVSLAWVEELSQFLIIIICFVGLSYGVGKGRHIRMTAIYDLFGDTARKVLMIVISASTAALMFVLTYYAIRYAQDVDSHSPVLDVPLRYVYMVAPLGLLLAGVQYVLVVIKNIRSQDVYLAYDKRDEYEEEHVGGI